MVVRHRLTFALFSLFMLSGIGCEQPVSSVAGSSSPDTTALDDLAGSEQPTDSDATSSQEDGEEVGELQGAEKLKVGDRAPDFEIEALGGETLRLSSYFGDPDQPTVLLFDRAHW